MSWAAVAAAGASIVGGVIGSQGAKSAAKKAKKGSDAQLQFAREAMAQARADSQHTRQAGATALNALMALTGLSGNANSTATVNGWPAENTGNLYGQPQMTVDQPQNLGGQAIRPWGRGSGYALRYAGGPMNSNTVYNVHELGPENIYRNGTYSRGTVPQSVSGEGYVQPNVEGRGFGGFLGSMSGIGLINNLLGK